MSTKTNASQFNWDAWRSIDWSITLVAKLSNGKALFLQQDPNSNIKAASGPYAVEVLGRWYWFDFESNAFGPGFSSQEIERLKFCKKTSERFDSRSGR